MEVTNQKQQQQQPMKKLSQNQKNAIIIVCVIAGILLASKFDQDIRELEAQPYYSHQIEK